MILTHLEVPDSVYVAADEFVDGKDDAEVRQTLHAVYIAMHKLAGLANLTIAAGNPTGVAVLQGLELIDQEADRIATERKVFAEVIQPPPISDPGEL